MPLWRAPSCANAPDRFSIPDKEKDYNPYLVILTGYREISYAQTAIRIGVSDFLLKPVRSEELLSTAIRLLKADGDWVYDSGLQSSDESGSEKNNDYVRR